MRRAVLKLLFAPGAGGNWLIHTVNNMPLNQNGINFHRHTWTSRSVLLEPTHHVSQEPLLFMHGNINLNFFLNSIYKFWISEARCGNDIVWFLNKMLRNWAVIVKLSQLDRAPDFEWQYLLHDAERSHQQLLAIQSQHNQPLMSFEEFAYRRQALFDTMVSPNNVYQNWDHDIWVLTVLADLKVQNLLPESWQFEQHVSWASYQNLAWQHREQTKNIKCHDFGTSVMVSNLKDLTQFAE